MTSHPSLKKRLYASYVDLVLYVGFAYIIGYLATIFHLYSNSSYNTFAFITFGVFLTYDIYTMYIYHATLGKRLFGLKIENADGSRPTFRTILFRETIGKGISLLPLGLGVWWILFDKEKEAWHDKLTKTHIIDVRDK